MIPVSLLLVMLGMIPLYGSDAAPVMLAKLPSTVFSILFILTLAVFYALLNRIRVGGVVVGLGWVHFAAYFLTQIGEANFDYVRNRMLADGEPLRAENLVIAGSFTTLASFISAAVFFSVVLVAYFDRKPDANPAAFD